MADMKLVVIYPRPKDVDVFEKVYQEEHVPLAVAKLGGKTKMVATKVLGSPQGVSPFYRFAEVYFPSMQALEACAASEGGKGCTSDLGDDLMRPPVFSVSGVPRNLRIVR